jgi:AcrR family transcriptional regulator
MKGQDQNSEEVMLTAARKVFQQKGFEGTTLQAIADEAGTTKSMVNYYFRSKEKLFAAIFKMEFREFYGGIQELLMTESTVKEKITLLVELDMKKLSKIPTLPLFIISEVNRDPSIIKTLVAQSAPERVLAAFGAQIQREVEAGIIRPITVPDLFLNIQALTIFPFIARPMVINLLKLSEDEYLVMLEHRKKSVVEFIWNAIKV